MNSKGGRKIAARSKSKNKAFEEVKMTIKKIGSPIRT